jgi:nucleoside-diphosphate-sugar epimerase
MERIAQGLQPVIYGTGMQTRDLVHIRDVTAGITAALQRDIPSGLTANIGSGKETAINEVARILLRLSGSTQAPAYLAERTGDILHSRADIGKAARLLGYAPKIPLETGLRETWNWYCSTRQE